MKSSVITFPGSNCDRDMDVALTKFGFKNKMVWHNDQELPKSDLIVYLVVFLTVIIYVVALLAQSKKLCIK